MLSTPHDVRPLMFVKRDLSLSLKVGENTRGLIWWHWWNLNNNKCVCELKGRKVSHGKDMICRFI